VWKRQLVEETQAQVTVWGFTGAPTVFKNLLIMNVGEAAWRWTRRRGRKCGNRARIPILASARRCRDAERPDGDLAGQREGVSLGGAGNGEAELEHQMADGIRRERGGSVPYGDKVFVSSGYGKGCALYTPPATPDGEPGEIWKNRVLRTQLNGAVLVDKHVYGVDGDTSGKAAPLKCVEIETGNQLWAQPDFGNGGMIVADERSSRFLEG
jgi:hypothetical protein